MIPDNLRAGTQVLALRSGYGIEAGQPYTVRGYVLNRHWRTREPDPHVLFWELDFPRGERGPIGFPRDAFRLPEPAKQHCDAETVLA